MSHNRNLLKYGLPKARGRLHLLLAGTVPCESSLPRDLIAAHMEVTSSKAAQPHRLQVRGVRGGAVGVLDPFPNDLHTDQASPLP